MELMLRAPAGPVPSPMAMTTSLSDLGPLGCDAHLLTPPSGETRTPALEKLGESAALR